jgi:tetratricopeptide (TPR) repeat protein
VVPTAAAGVGRAAAARVGPGVAAPRMRASLVVVAAIVLAAALVPEVRRYHAERELRRLTTAFHVAVTQAADGRLLGSVAGGAAVVDEALAPDARALILAGSAHLVARQAAAALALYRRAFERGERAEIDLNAGRALALLGRTDAADAAVLRAVWVNPTLIDVLPRATRASWRRRVQRLRHELRAGRLAAPPPAPEWEAP